MALVEAFVTRSAARSARSRRATAERELRMVCEAIAMVASGVSPRVVLGGLSGSDANLVDAGRRMALESGVRLLLLDGPSDTRPDVAIEPIRE
jgi:hypothetical protein